MKLLDFGLALFARSLDGADAAGAEVAGTLGYMAPEVLMGALPSEASDLFAVGVMAHELLLGPHPLERLPTDALIQRFCDPAPLFSEDPRLGSALSGILRRALRLSPNERYSDAAAFGQAQQLARETSEYEKRAGDPVVRLIVRGQLAMAAVRLGDLAEARKQADAGLEVLRATATIAFGAAGGIACLAAAYTELWSASRDPADRAVLRARIKHPLAALRRMAVLFPICRPQALLCHARYAVLRGAPGVAEWLLRKALQSAQRCDMPHEAGLAHQGLAELAAARGEHELAARERRSAAALFERIGARWDLSQVKG